MSWSSKNPKRRDLCSESHVDAVRHLPALFRRELRAGGHGALVMGRIVLGHDRA